MMNVAIVGLRPVVAGAGLTTPASITTAQSIVLPTASQWPLKRGVLECYISIEGTVTSRYTWNGVTATTTVGLLLPASTAAAPVTMVLYGEGIISTFSIIGTAAGNSWTYNFAVKDVR